MTRGSLTGDPVGLDNERASRHSQMMAIDATELIERFLEDVRVQLLELRNRPAIAVLTS